MVIPAIAPNPANQTAKQPKAQKRERERDREAGFLSLLVSLFPSVLFLQPPRRPRPLDFAGLFRALSWTAAVVVGGGGTNPNHRPTQPPSERTSDPRVRGNINPLKNATAALNGRSNERRTDRSAWKPVIKCELLSPSLIRRLCTKVVVTCRRFCPEQNSTSCSLSAVGGSLRSHGDGSA